MAVWRYGQGLDLGLVSGGLTTEVPKCPRFWKHCRNGLSPHENIRKILEPDLYDFPVELYTIL